MERIIVLGGAFSTGKSTMMKQIEHNTRVHSANMDLTSQAMDLATQGQEGGETSQSPNFAVHPHVALAHISEAAQKLNAAADRIAAPRRLVRDLATGKAIGTEPVQ